MDTDLAATRRSLHAVAELVLAGPQYRAHQDIRLQVRPYGFGTVIGPDVRVVGATATRDDVVVTLDGKPAAEIARALGLQARDLEDVYHDGSHVPLDEPLAVSDEHARHIAACYVAGDAALSEFAPDAERVLWPEHFDVAIRVDEVNYGVLPGDGFVAEPYAYVGPGEVPDGDFWNAPFGATLTLGAAPSAADIVAFFVAGRDRLR